MITQVNIEHFKSVRTAELECRRVNVFIGEPNSGKSNILEALGFLSWMGHKGENLAGFVRFGDLLNLFYDNFVDQPVTISVRQNGAVLNARLEFSGKAYRALLGDRFECELVAQGTVQVWTSRGDNPAEHIQFYRYDGASDWSKPQPGALSPPSGSNLFAVLFSNRELRQWSAALFRDFGLRLVFRPQDRVMEIQKEQEGVAVVYPYSVVSDTLQRAIFFHAAMVSNRDSVLIFEEPEAHAFPFYTKQLGERIARDETNQYFIATHNPYLLTAIVEKAPADQVAIFVTTYENYATQVHRLTDDEVSLLMDQDPILGVENVLQSLKE